MLILRLTSLSPLLASDAISSSEIIHLFISLAIVKPLVNSSKLLFLTSLKFSSFKKYVKCSMISLSVFAIFANPFLSKYFAFSLSWPGTGFKRIKGTYPFICPTNR